MNKKILDKLVKIADNLDREGLFDHADKIDSLIEDAKKTDVIEFDLHIPQEEKDILDNILESLKESLK